jgi:hypothetical protein
VITPRYLLVKIQTYLKQNELFKRDAGALNVTVLPEVLTVSLPAADRERPHGVKTP